MKFGYENLEVAHLSRKIIKEVYSISEKFPKTEIYGLTNQIRRASISILLNIAEGNSFRSKKDFKRFIQISIGSLSEVHACLMVAQDLEFFDIQVYKKIQPSIQELYFKLLALSKYLGSTDQTVKQ